MAIAGDQALSIGVLRYDRRVHVGVCAGPVVLPAAGRLPGLLAEALRGLGSARPARQADRRVVAVRARRAPTP